MRYTFVWLTKIAQGQAMQAGIKFTAILVAAVSLSACGFKSALSIPGDGAKEVDDLIVPDSELVEAELPLSLIHI